MKSIIKIAITGGVCSGKTTALPQIYDRYKDKYNCIIVPESATIVCEKGLDCRDSGEYVLFQDRVIAQQLESEANAILKGEDSEKPTLIILDRGLLDSFAYIGETARELFEKRGIDIESLFSRYDGVIHLVTAAKGAEEYYTTANNAARTETAHEARELDDKVLKAWQGCKNHFVIENNGDFKRKLSDMFEAIEEICK